MNLLISQAIENLDALVNLEELWLGKNKITKLEVRPGQPLNSSDIHFHYTEPRQLTETQNPLDSIQPDHKTRRTGLAHQP